MHLDTVCTMIDYDKFTTHSAILKSEGNMNIFIIEYDDKAEDIKIQHSSHLKQTLEEVHKCSTSWNLNRHHLFKSR